MTPGEWTAIDPDPAEWPVLVTGAGGFVGGHVARHLARAGHRVRGLTRAMPIERSGDPSIEWVFGDIRDAEVRHSAVAGARGVIHTAAWVSLGRDRRGISRSINVDATRSLLEESRRSGVERFVYTSTLHTLAAGTSAAPADEETPWNLQNVDSPYARTKREAEGIVRMASDSSFSTVVLCPGMVLGPRDPKPTSTKLVRTLASTPIAVIPIGGIPIVDASVVAIAHRRALISGLPGGRYAVVGPYLSFIELARVVAELSGNPRLILAMPRFMEVPLKGFASLVDRLDPAKEISPTTVAGGYLQFHVSGRKADACFRLTHPPALDSIHATLRRDAAEN